MVCLVPFGLPLEDRCLGAEALGLSVFVLSPSGFVPVAFCMVEIAMRFPSLRREMWDLAQFSFTDLIASFPERGFPVPLVNSFLSSSAMRRASAAVGLR